MFPPSLSTEKKRPQEACPEAVSLCCPTGYEVRGRWARYRSILAERLPPAEQRTARASRPRPSPHKSGGTAAVIPLRRAGLRCAKSHIKNPN